MGIEALTHRENGTAVAVPNSCDDWRHWVSAGRTRNWMMNDTLLDWLELYGEKRGYRPLNQWVDYREDLDFLPFIFAQGREFEEGILGLLNERYEVTAIASDRRDIRSLSKAEETFVAMRQGLPIIHQAVLWDAENLTYGAPDFLIRSDVLYELFPNDISEAEARVAAPGLGDVQWHYRVVDTKFTTIRLNAAGTGLLNQGSAPAYKAQLYLYNRMLGRLQNYLPSESYLLGRGWQQGSGATAVRCANALNRLGHVPQEGNVNERPQVRISDAVEEALEWIRRVRTEGHEWQLTPPSVPELYPNMSGSSDDMQIDRNHPVPDADAEDGTSPDWGSVKKWLAEELKELTLLPNVGPPRRRAAHDAGIYRWDAPGLTPAAVGVSGGQQGPTLQRFLDVNTRNGQLILPDCIERDRDIWHPTPALEFYVDFEFCQDLNDDFKNLPEKGGRPLIFMIGCGHMEDGDWQFTCWVTDQLTEEEELRIIREWVEHMRSVGGRVDPDNSQPRIFHWHWAETGQLETNYNSARRRHGDQATWPELAWYDFLNQVMNKEPVVVKGAWGFGLKAIANSMCKHGMIETDWGDSQVDGLGAMVGAWHCDEAARRKGTSMADEPLMKEIIEYNEVDCRVMMEIIRYLRENH